MFYWSKLYSKQIERGEIYEKLNRTISIIFLDYEIEKLKEFKIKLRIGEILFF
ncbi:MAG: PD-(D/E)XK nuclease family transposase [Clostridia bacterium]|nr:PD-(D/E)XK nuclease family transposase [Clostridia bacterium]